MNYGQIAQTWLNLTLIGHQNVAGKNALFDMILLHLFIEVIHSLRRKLNKKQFMLLWMMTYI